MTQGRSRLWQGALVAIALGGVLRLWFIAHTFIVSADTLMYGDIAQSWMHHGIYGFRQADGPPLPTLIRLPGYPLFLMFSFLVFGAEHYRAAAYLQCVIDLFACLVLATLVRHLFRTRSGMAALFLSALCPFTASYVAAPLTETLTCATITLAFFALERWRPRRAGETIGTWTPWNRWLWLLSAAVSYSILLRPDQVLLAAAVLPAVFWLSSAAPKWAVTLSGWGSGLPVRRTLPVFAAALLIGLPLIAWTVRNERTFHVFEPLAPRSATDPGEAIPTGFYRWYRTWAVDYASTEDVYWNYDGAQIQIADLPNRAFDSPAQYAHTASVLQDYDLTARPSAELDARFEELAEQRIVGGRIRYYLELPVFRLANMLLRPRVEMLPIPLAWWRADEHPKQTAFAVVYGALSLAYLAAGAIGLFRWAWRSDSASRPIAWSMIGYIFLRCGLLLTLDNSEPRYTLEFFPILIVGIASLFSRSDGERAVAG